MTATAHLPLLERLRKGAKCVVFLDGAPEPAADVADIMTKAADEIERQRRQLIGLLDHWREFGPEYGFDELIETCAGKLKE